MSLMATSVEYRGSAMVTFSERRRPDQTVKTPRRLVKKTVWRPLEPIRGTDYLETYPTADAIMTAHYT